MAGENQSSTEALVEEGPLPSSSRAKILDAAVQVALRDGILAMTLDAVAKEAGVSKGGLIYHFRSKDDLIAAMLVHFRSKTRAHDRGPAAADPNPRGRWFRAIVRTIWRPRQAGEVGAVASPDMSRFFTAMLAASANNPHLLDSVPRELMPDERAVDRRRTQWAASARPLGRDSRPAPLAKPGHPVARRSPL